MYNQILAVSTLFALSACSTDFEVQDGEQGIEPTVQSSSDSNVAELENADVSSIAFQRIDADFDIIYDDILETSASVSNVSTDSNIDSLSVKRVENELQIRVFPAQNSYAKFCTYGQTTTCFTGKTQPADNIDASEILIDLSDLNKPKSFQMKLYNNDTIYQKTELLSIPSTENIWTEAISCDPKIQLSHLRYDVHQTDRGDFVRLDFETQSYTSAMVCGLDDSGDNVCLWEELTDGHRKFMLPVDLDAVHPALLRDKKGCSMEINVTP